MRTHRYDPTHMNGIVINVNWEYFFGLVGTLVALAYYANGRFTRLEVSVDWLKEALRGLKISTENSEARLFDLSSPITLTRAGDRLLRLSGLKAYIHDHAEELRAQCQCPLGGDPYKLQSCLFRTFGEVALETDFEHQLNEFAFSNGVSVEILRRLGAIYLRDLTPERSIHVDS